MRRGLLCALISVGTAAIIAACQSRGRDDQTLRPQAFYAPSPSAAQQPPATRPITAESAPAASVPPVPGVSSAPVPSPSPDPGVSTGSYMVVGTVIAVANGQPVYADKVLALVDRALAEKARELSPAEFRVEAENIIRQARDLEIRSELEFAAAQRKTTGDEQDLAKRLAMLWRQNEITRAGGSLAVARRKALEEDGIDFDQKVSDQHRLFLVRIFYEKHIFPRIQISADDVRRYYDDHVQDFTEKSAVQFRLFKAPYRNDANDKKRALAKIQEIHQKAKNGHEFADLARQNTDPVLNKNGGFLLMEKDPDGRLRGAFTEKGTFTIEQVEKTVFALTVGEITNIIDEQGAYYIAKLEGRKVGRVHPFEEISVQEFITRQLRSDQARKLQYDERMKLLRSSIWSNQDAALQTAVDMAMQKYPIWRSAKPAEVSATR